MTNGLVYEPTAELVARNLVTTGAYLVARNPADSETWFTWKSGIRAPVYTNCRLIPGHPGPSATIVRALASSIQVNFPDAELLVGMAEAGIGWAAQTAAELGLPWAFIRKEAKLHGPEAGKHVECSPPERARAVVLDDLLASGDTIEQKAIPYLRDEKAITTIGVQSIVNWDFREMRDRFVKLGICVRALVSFPHLIDEVVRAGQLPTAAGRELRLFYANPRQHQWNIKSFRPDAADNVING